MKHGAFYNENCRACRVIFNIIFWPSMILSVVAMIVGLVVGIKMHLYRGAFSFLLVPPIMYAANKITNLIVPQSHGMFLDVCNDTKWYKPKNNTPRSSVAQKKGQDETI